MTPLVVVIAGVLLIVVVANLIGRARAGRRSVRSHHRALDTLGHISTQHQSDDPRRRTAAPLPPPPRSGRQAHVRVVSADAEALPAPRPMTGGWRPTRATGAAPFRRPPTERHDLWDDPATAAQSSDAASAATVAVPSAMDKVRLVADVSGDPHFDEDRDLSDDRDFGDPDLKDPDLADPDLGNPDFSDAGDVSDGLDVGDEPGFDEHEPAAVDPTVAEPVTAENRAVTDEPGAGRSWDREVHDPTSDRDPWARAGAADWLAAREVSPSSAGRTDGGDRREGAGRGDGAMSFDDTAPPAEASTGPVPAHRPRGLPAGTWASTPPRPARTDLAALAAGPAGRTGRSHQRRPARRPRDHRRALSAVLIVVVVAGLAVGGVLALGGHKHHANVAAPVVHHRHHSPAPKAPVVTTPTTAALTFKLISSAPGASYYQLSGAQRITVKATGPCWIEIRRTNDAGALLYTETMAAGAVETVTGPVWLRLGAPTAVTVTVGGRALSAPVTAGEPYDLEFE